MFAGFACSGEDLFSETSGNRMSGKIGKVLALTSNASSVYGNHSGTPKG